MNPATPPLGLHHITAISGQAVENVRFYTQVLGLRLAKRSVNQDDPGTYHLFYTDGDAHPGTDITFFPWAHAPQHTPGVGVVGETMLTIPIGTMDAWATRLQGHGVRTEAFAERFGERALPFFDPHGMRLALVEGPQAFGFTPWHKSPVPPQEQILGLHGARVPIRELGPSDAFLRDVMGFERSGEEHGWVRYTLPGAPSGGAGHILDLREAPLERRGAWGVGSVHHLAWTVRDTAHQEALREAVALAGRRPSEIIDRFWFRSVYFMEPGGILFELATEGPGFAIDEEPEHLGEQLILPPWLEPHRRQIEATLPDLSDALQGQA
jgi:glyoxalase family protein